MIILGTLLLVIYLRLSVVMLRYLVFGRAHGDESA
jgi:hypothetical protein